MVKDPESPGKSDAMTIHRDDPTDTRRVMCDGGTPVVTKTQQATDVVTRETDGENQEMIRVPISSTRPDREGDRFSKEALDDMAERIAMENPMVFDNHGLAGDWMSAIPYDSRETIGAQMEAEVESAEDGEHDLYALVNPDGTHPEGQRMLKQVRDEGQPIKFSVGFRVLGYEAREDVEADYEGDGRVFQSADLMETSRVGIPANPDASVTQSVTAKDGLPGYSQHPMMQMMAAMQGDQDVPEQMATKDAVGSETVEDATPVDVDGKSEDEAKPKCDSDADCPDGQVCQDGHCVDEDEASSTTTTDTKGFEDVGMTEFDEFVASHMEGADTADVGDALDSVGEWVGQLDRDETAALVAEACDVTPGEVQEQFDEWLEGGGDDDGDDDDTEEDSSLPDAVRQELREQREQNDELQKELDDIRKSISDRGDSKTGDTSMDDASPDETGEADVDDSGADSEESKDSKNGLLF